MAVHLLAGRAAVTPRHDGLVALQLAAGSLDRWSELVDAPSWHTAGTYQSLLEPDRPTPVAVVRDEVARLDVHPPGFPLVLSWWQPVAGRSMRMLLLVDVAALGALAWVLGGLARRLGASPPLAAVAAVAGAACPGLVATGLELRPYALGALGAAVLASWAVAVVDDDGSGPLPPRRWVQGALATLALAFTSSSGVFVGAGAVVVVVVLGRRWSRRLGAAGAVLAGGFADLVVWPHVFDQLAEQTRRQADPLFEATAIRVGHVVRSLASPVWVDAPTLVAAVVVVGLVAASVATCRRRGRPAVALAVLTGIGVLGHVAFYVVGRSQRWAMAPKYLAFVLPLVAVLAVLAARGRRGVAVAAAGLAGCVLLGAGSATAVLEPAPPPEVATVDAVVVTNPRRGVGLRQLWHVPADTAAVVGARHQLLPLLFDVPGCRLLVVHNDQGGASSVSEAEFDRAVQDAGWQLTPLPPTSRESRTALATRPDCPSSDRHDTDQP